MRAHFSATLGALARAIAPTVLATAALSGCDAPSSEPSRELAALTVPSPTASASGSPWASREACEQLSPPAATPGRARIASWNVRWFPDGQPDGPHPDRATDVDWLACAIARLGAPVVALQEILLHERGREALARLRASLDRRTGGRWEAHDDGCAAGTQQLVLLVDAARVQVSDVRAIAALNPTGGGPCAHRLRPGLAARLRFPGGLDLTLVDLHLDSGTGRRDYGNRRASLAALAREAPALAAGDSDVVVLGDFNTMGCRECSPRVGADEEIALVERELDAAGLARLAPTQSCTEYGSSRRSQLDHVAVSRATAELPRGARARVDGVCEALACRAPRRGDPAADALTRLSDHCPLVIELDDVDRD